MARDMVAAIKSVMDMSDAEIKKFARHDPDIFRDVARAASVRIGLRQFGAPPCDDCLDGGECTMNCSGAETREALVFPRLPRS